MKPLRGMDLKRFLAAQPRPERALSVILHDVEDPVNVGAAFRTADAVGVSQVILTGITPRPPHKLIDRVGRKKHKRVRWEYIPDVLDAIAEAGAGEYAYIADPLECGRDAAGVEGRVLERGADRIHDPRLLRI